MTRLLSLRVEADGLRDTIAGVPRIADLLRREGAGATFLFALGPDRTGRAIGRILREHLSRRSRAVSMRARYGLRALVQGTLLPAPDVGTRGADEMRRVRDAGFEVGLHGWDATGWIADVEAADECWTVREMTRACERFIAIFGEPAKVHAAPGWRMNVHAFRLTQRLGFDYATDTRGVTPFVPIIDAEPVACPQVPTTLPTLEELLLDGAADIDAAVVQLLARTAGQSHPHHVFTLRAGFDGTAHLAACERLLAGWRAQGWELVSLRTLLEAAAETDLPRHRVENVGARESSASQAWQGREFLA